MSVSPLHIGSNMDGMKCSSWVVRPTRIGMLECNCISNETDMEELMFKNIEFTGQYGCQIVSRASF
jgi:hypothetical protein